MLIKGTQIETRIWKPNLKNQSCVLIEKNNTILLYVHKNETTKT